MLICNKTNVSLGYAQDRLCLIITSLSYIYVCFQKFFIIPLWVSCDDLELFRVMDSFTNHLVIRHCSPRVSQAKEETVGEKMSLAWLHILRDNKERSRKDQTGPSIRFGLKVHEECGKASHRFTKEESREMLIRLAVTYMLKE